MFSPLHSYCMPVLSEWFNGFRNGGDSITRSIRGPYSQVTSSAYTVHNDMECHVVYLGKPSFLPLFSVNA